MKRSPLRLIGGVLLGFIVFAVASQAVLMLGPALGGWIVTAFDIPPSPRTAKNLESVGNIIVLLISAYLGIKTYKKVAGNKTKTTNQL